MENQVLSFVLAVLMVYVSGAAVDLEAPMEPNTSSYVQVVDHNSEVETTSICNRNLISGIINPGDKVLHRGYYTKQALVNTVQTQNIIYRGKNTTVITYISALVIGSTQFASAQITAGGLGNNYVTIRLSSTNSSGYNFWIEVWGR